MPGWSGPGGTDRSKTATGTSAGRCRSRRYSRHFWIFSSVSGPPTLLPRPPEPCPGVEGGIDGGEPPTVEPSRRSCGRVPGSRLVTSTGNSSTTGCSERPEGRSHRSTPGTPCSYGDYFRSPQIHPRHSTLSVFLSYPLIQSQCYGGSRSVHCLITPLLPSTTDEVHFSPSILKVSRMATVQS